jgi:hypothetical protein
VEWPDQGDESGPSPPIWFVIGGLGEAGTILAMRALCEQAAVNSSRSLYIRRYRCSAGVRGPLISRLYARTANLVGLLLRFKGGKKLDDFSGASVIWLFSKCLVENTVVRHHCEPDHNGNKSYLRADAQHDTLFDPLVGMNPAMKSLKGPQRLMRKVGVNSVEGIGQHGPEGAE